MGDTLGASKANPKLRSVPCVQAELPNAQERAEPLLVASSRPHGAVDGFGHPWEGTELVQDSNHGGTRRGRICKGAANPPLGPGSKW